MTKTELAERFGISRQTIHRWIRDGELDRDLSSETVRYRPRPRVPRKLDPYKELIVSRLVEYPKLTAVRLLQEIKAAGYPGGYTQLKEYVRQVRPRPPEEPVVRFETPPGHQGQVDFADFRLPWGKRYALLVVLGFSRFLWLHYFPRKTMRHLVEGLEAAFASFGGVPRELLFDQMKAVVIDDSRDEGGRVTENAEFLRFARHWGFRVRACRPYRAKTKGKVERPVSYVRSSFFYGRTFTGDGDLNHQARSWLDQVANVRIHGTVRERPVDRLARERGDLKPLAPHPYRSFVLPAEPAKRKKAILPRIEVQRRPLEAYARLKMPGALEALDDVLAGVDGGSATAAEAIEQLLGSQISLRNNRRLQAAMRSSRLPAIKTLEDFDFSFQPSIKREQIDSLHELGFLERKENVIFFGPPGVGKTHLAISLAIAAAQSGRRVYYGTLADIIASLEEARAAGRLAHRLKTLTHPSLLVVDEIGYLPINQTGAMLFFQLINRRYEQASTVLTSNKGFEDWGQVLGDDVMAAALIDRLVHHCHIVNIRGNSFRMRHHTELSKALLAEFDTEKPSPRRRRRRTKEAVTN
jgi:DNA replication protein DnaC/transposase